MDKKAAHLARRMKAAAACDHMAEKLVESTLGRHVLDIIGRGETLAASSLLASLQAEVHASPSNCGRGLRELDLVRLSAEKAIDALTMELASWPTEDQTASDRKRTST